ncbi:MAG: hypothetical protein NUV77_26845, partial [Thermoguttaceae bacterium]|nr:hypothetical protein [Thermoguttaceae bacterium]
ERELNCEDGGPNDPAMVAGYWVIIGADVRESVIGVDLNGDSDTNDTCGSYVMLIRPNAPGVREVVAQGA